jgi:tRNA(fMet)-specific endonuclease VapC
LNKALLDTDIYSEILKAANPTVTANATNYRRAQGFLTFSTVTVMEVVRGFQKNQSTRRLNAFLAAIALEEILPFDQPAAELAGRIAGELERIGQPIGTADPMIAAIALHHGLELVTGNTSHFQRVQQLGYPLT